jgi:hypothetical protein
MCTNKKLSGMLRAATVIFFGAMLCEYSHGADVFERMDLDRIDRIDNAFKKIKNIILKKSNDANLDVFPLVKDAINAFKTSTDFEIFLQCLLAMSKHNDSDAGICVFEAAIDLCIADIANRIDDDAITALIKIKNRWADGGLGLALASAIDFQKRKVLEKSQRIPARARNEQEARPEPGKQDGHDK